MSNITININAPIHFHNCPLSNPDTLLHLMGLLDDIDEFDDDTNFGCDDEEQDDSPTATDDEENYGVPVVLYIGGDLPEDLSPEDMAKIALTHLFHPDQDQGDNHGRT